MFKVGPYEKDDVLRVHLLREAAYLMSYPGGELRWERAAGNGVTRTIYGDGEVVAVVGLLWFYPRSAEVWMLAGELVRRSPWKFLLCVKELLDDEIGKREKPCRVQAMSLSKWRQSGKFIEALGFRREATLCAFNQDSEDMDMWARVVYG
jgi:hypothetical protein